MTFYQQKYAKRLRLREELRKAAQFRQRTIERHLQHVPPAEPTEALPGTRAKIAVLQARLERGEFLYHPEDATHFSTDD